jgi:hypothetical protein
MLEERGWLIAIPALLFLPLSMACPCRSQGVEMSDIVSGMIKHPKSYGYWQGVAPKVQFN